MGLDNLWRVQLALPLLALLVTLFVSGPAALLSFGAWKWSLLRRTKGYSVRSSRVASVFALVITGLPIVYILGLVMSLPGPFGVAGLLLVLGVALLALIHAAFRDESIREIGANQAPAETLAPPFAGATKARALKRAATVALVWMVPFALLLLIRS